ncbi:unnamed protein product [Rhizophagus irregularis]|uniref:Uncharacterized protein n=1 Tax=Rhizophagus irregularis TaxID=588596 RepID=A0A915ZUF9_9GLOM|nr:unnamed protein product [Rhizophagus irregularis]CAB5387751.1 unnamed protein product [Rhizophagus irregularis]
MDDIRNKAEEEPQLKEQLLNSLQPTLELMENLIKRLELKGEQFGTFKAAFDEEMTTLWNSLLSIDNLLTMEDNSKRSIQNKIKFLEFYNHCCRSRHYFFEIKKCGSLDWHICKPVRCDSETWLKVHNFPDPIPSLDGKKYKSFEELYGQETSEEYRPSLKYKKNSNNEMGFKPSAQCCKNVGTLIQCGECDKWRVIYSKSKLALQESEELARFLDEIQYTDGDSFYDIASNDTNDSMKKLFSIVKVNNTLTCNSPIEIPYYSSRLFKEVLCFNCGVECEEHNTNHGEYFPYCEDCDSMSDENKKRKRKEKKFVKSSKQKNVETN